MRMLPLLGWMLLASLTGHAQADLAAQFQVDWYAPRAEAFERQARSLVPAVQAVCQATHEEAETALGKARMSWVDTLANWERLAGVALGPVLTRRAQRAIDFTPTRPRLIEKAIKAAPRSRAALELIGTPAKGLPALEWLLWVKPVQPTTASCDYAVQVAEDIQREAGMLVQTPHAAQDDPAFLTDLVNQWVAGLERLRWPGMEMPVRVALTASPPKQPDYPRRDSAAYMTAWRAQWDALRDLAVLGHVSLVSGLKSRGYAALAATLAAEVERADRAALALDGVDTNRVLAFTQVLAELKYRVENEVAPALGVSIGFSDADGD